MLQKAWKLLKKWHTLRLGPLAFVFRFDRSVAVTRNTAQRRRKLARPEGRERQGELALIVGVGPGFGHGLARRLAREGFAVVLASRNARRLDALVDEIQRDGGTAAAYGCDATSEASVAELFACVQAQHGAPHLVVYSLQSSGPGQVVDIELVAFEQAWRHNCLGAFLVARQSARAMLPAARGTIVLVGSTSSLLGRAGYLNLAVGKFGQRALAQVLARELWPQGIHVAHLLIDADIDDGEPRDDGGPQADPEHIADVVVSLHRQPRSAWTSEIDVRPWNEQFWEHC